MPLHFYSPPTAQTILQTSLRWYRTNDLAQCTKENIEVAIAAGEYELLLTEMMRHIANPAQRRELNYNEMKNLFAPATPEQIERIVLPKFMPFLHEAYNPLQLYKYQVIPTILQKMNADCLEKIAPALLQFCNQDRIVDLSEEILFICIEKMKASDIEKIIIPGLFQLSEQSPDNSNLIECIYNKLLLKCIEKMGINASMRSLQSDFESRFTQIETDINQGRISRDRAFVPYLSLISQFNKNEVDKISELLLKHLSINLRTTTANRILEFINKLHRDKKYVNPAFFQAVQKIVEDHNNQCLQNGRDFDLSISNMTAAQVRTFFHKKKFDNELKMDASLGARLKQLAALPVEIYPMELRMKSLDFLEAHLHKKNEHALYCLTDCFKTGEFSGSECKNRLIQFAQHALEQIEAICNYEQQGNRVALDLMNLEAYQAGMREIMNRPSPPITKSHYCKFLESCVSLMTEQELLIKILPSIERMLKFSTTGTSVDKDLIRALTPCLIQLFSKIEHNFVLDAWFNYFFHLYKAGEIDGDIMPILSSKVDLGTLSRANRAILQSNNIDYVVLGKHAYLLALFSKRIPNKTNEDHHTEIKEGSPNHCALM